MSPKLIAFPEYRFERRGQKGKEHIFDPIRRKWVSATPEEVVRQHVLRALLDLGYPRGLTAVEKGFEAFGKMWRADVAVYDRNGKPLLLAECKAPNVPIDQHVFDQLARYNASVGARFLLATNGSVLLVAALGDTSMEFLDHLPGYQDLIGR
ncbi:MAG: type I restriction enzyme HsdR N-terminal domain-containing protein [Rubricoccaceae bacterium]|nr:type I restriction enzyme HsdR N-terminal domain-containing protein [Rubricoccaceae bacterium]